MGREERLILPIFAEPTEYFLIFQDFYLAEINESPFGIAGTILHDACGIACTGCARQIHCCRYAGGVITQSSIHRAPLLPRLRVIETVMLKHAHDDGGRIYWQSFSYLIRLVRHWIEVLPIRSDPAHAMYWPPLASMQEPVMKPASSAARNVTQRAISSAVPSRPAGISGMILVSSTSFGTACTISVLM
jgi:hypothetical protein